MSNDDIVTDVANPNNVAEEEFMDAQESPNRGFLQVLPFLHRGV
jgi:hypothetical protein